MFQRESEENVYLSPQSVSSRIKTINDEIESRISEGRKSVHERQAERYKESLKEQEVRCSKVSSIQEEVEPSKVKASIVTPSFPSFSPSLMSHKKQPSSGCISIDKRLSTSPFKQNGFNKSQQKKETPKQSYPNLSTSNTPSVKSCGSLSPPPTRVREIIDNFSLKLPSKEKKNNPFRKGSTTVRDDLSILSINPNPSPFSSRPTPITLSPINVLYTPKQPPFVPKASIGEAPLKKAFNKAPSFESTLYGPGVELTGGIQFVLLNTVWYFKSHEEDTIYYFKIESNTSWIVRKTLSQIQSFLKARKLEKSLVPSEKKVRDNVIVTLLNMAGKERTEELQSFILSGVVKETEKRSTYLLMAPLSEPFNFRLVGQALVCYDKSNRVHKLFLLRGCTVEPSTEFSFRVSSKEESVVLYASCTTERDCWVEDIKEFIQQVENKKVC